MTTYPLEDFIAKVNFESVYDHYTARIDARNTILTLFKKAITIEDKKYLAEYILSIHNLHANYSAHRYGGGKIILSSNPNAHHRLLLFVNSLMTSEEKELIKRIKECGMLNLAISIGSEIACMLRPDYWWVTNRRTVWAKTLVDTGNSDMAYELIRMYQQEVKYTLHPDVKLGLIKLMSYIKEDNLPKDLNQYFYLFADCVANDLYIQYVDDD